MKYSRKALSILLSIMMVLSVFAMVPIHAAAVEMTDQSAATVGYIERSWNGTKVVEQSKTVKATIITASNDDWVYLKDTESAWYYVDGKVTMGKKTTIKVVGNVKLILCDGAELTVTEAVNIPDGSTLTIYGQNQGTGKLKASHHQGGNPGIGARGYGKGGNLVIHGGTIVAKGDTNGAGIGGANKKGFGDITIYGGTITSNGGSSGAGIGRGQKNDDTDFGTITIYGGNITAQGGRNAAGIGGGIIALGKLTVIDTTISGNTANSEGGGLWITSASMTEMTITGCTIVNNQGTNGGGICLDTNCDLKLTDCEITDNRATRSGGGLHVYGSNWPTVTGCSFDGNTSESSGGAIWVKDHLKITDSSLTGNISTGGSGGGVYLSGTAKSEMDNCSFINNNSAQWGGGVYLYDGANLQMNGGTLEGNSCGNNGGGIHVSSKANLDASGVLQILDNLRGEDANNLNLAKGAKIHIADSLEGSSIGVSVSGNDQELPVVLTDGLDGKGTAENFVSDNTARVVSLNTNNEAILDIPCVLVFDAGSDIDSGTEEVDRVAPNVSYVLPECYFTAPKGCVFKAWSVEIGDDEPLIKAPGDMITVTGDSITVTALWEQLLPEFSTQSLILDGQIGVNFFLDLSVLTEEEKADSYMTFDITGKGSTTERDDYDPEYMNTSGEYNGFTCYVNSVQMADTITATFHYSKDGEEKTVEKQYSVKEYIETFDEDKDQFDEKTAGLVKSLADYGHYVQPFLSEARGWKVSTDYTEMEKCYTESYDIDQIRDAVEDYKIIRKNRNPDISMITYYLTLDSETAVNVIFKPVTGYRGSLKVTVDGKTAEAVKINGQYQVKIANIAAHQLGDTHTIEVRTNRGTTSVKVSALSYVQGILASNPDENSQNAAAALYSYFKAAEDYLNR